MTPPPPARRAADRDLVSAGVAVAAIVVAGVVVLGVLAAVVVLELQGRPTDRIVALVVGPVIGAIPGLIAVMQNGSQRSQLGRVERTVGRELPERIDQVERAVHDQGR